MSLNRAKLAANFMIDWLTMMRTVEHELYIKGFFFEFYQYYTITALSRMIPKFENIIVIVEGWWRTEVRLPQY